MEFTIRLVFTFIPQYPTIIGYLANGMISNLKVQPHTTYFKCVLIIRL